MRSQRSLEGRVSVGVELVCMEVGGVQQALSCDAGE